MNSQELIPITEDWNTPIARGTLIGYKGLGEERGITAAYPVWSVIGNEIKFVLFYKNDRPVLDNTWFNSADLFINKEPIIVEIELKNPTTFQNELKTFFEPPNDTKEKVKLSRKEKLQQIIENDDAEKFGI